MMIPAQALSQAFGRGFNLGNTFEMTQLDRAPARVHKMLDAFKGAGFQHVRIPARWFPADTCMLSDTTFMGQLKDAVDHARGIGLSLILNTHDEYWLCSAFNGQPDSEAKFAALWKGIAATFDYVPQDKLIFEVLNEPDGVFGDTYKGAPPHAAGPIHLTRRINQVGYDAIRSVNPTRVIAVMPNAKGNIGQVTDVYPTPDTLPGGGADRYLLVSVHTYDPWDFCGQNGSDKIFSSQPAPVDALRANVAARVDALADWARGMRGAVGVICTEFGVGRLKVHELDDDLVREYLRTTARGLVAHGWAATVWEDGGWFALTYWPQGPTGPVKFLAGLEKAVLGSA